MIELALANPAFRPVISTALTGSPAAILLVEFSGDTPERRRRGCKLKELTALMGDLGLPAAWWRWRGCAQKDLWKWQAGLNIMMT